MMGGRSDRKSGGSMMTALPIVYRQLGPARRLVWILAVLALIGGLIDAASLYLVARLATALTDTSGEVAITVGSLFSWHLTLTETLWWSAALVGVLMLFSIPLAALAARLSAIALSNTRMTLLEAYLGSSWAYRADHPEGHLQHLATEFAPRNERYVTQLAAIIVNSAGILMSIAAAIFTAPAASAYFVIGLGLLAACYVPLNQAMSKLSGRYLTANRRFSSVVSQSSRLAQEIETFHVADELTVQLRKEVDEGSEVLRRFRLRTVVIPASYQNAALAVVIGVIALLRAGGSSQLTVMGPVLLLLVRALIFSRQLQYAVQQAIEMTPYALELDAQVAEMRANPTSDGERGLARIESLRVDDVSFSHIPGHFVLLDLSIDLPIGKVIGIAGPSGVGKSTLLMLLLRLRHPTIGRLMVNGNDLREINAAAWAAIVAYVPQENKLILGTVAENIAFYRTYDPAAIERAATQANLLDEVLALPEGFDTMIGPGARELSGGQKQRLGIARALLGEPQLLILDEPTSALDGGSEHLITQTIDSLRGTTTVVLVAHRAETLAVCDEVIELTRVAAPNQGSDLDFDFDLDVLPAV